MLNNIIKTQVISLWKEAFGDTDEEVCFFLDNCRNKELIAKDEEEKLFSMLFLVDCKINEKNAKYVYAASTFKSRRGYGDMTQLLNICKEKYSVIGLLPADEGLVDFYKKRGFVNKYSLDCISFDESDEIINEYLFEGSKLEKLFLLVYEKEN